MRRLASFPAIFQFSSNLGLPLRCSASFKSLAQSPNSNRFPTNLSLPSRFHPHASARARIGKSKSSNASLVHARSRKLCVHPPGHSSVRLLRLALLCETNSNSSEEAPHIARDLCCSPPSGLPLLPRLDQFFPFRPCGESSTSFRLCSKVRGVHLDRKGAMGKKRRQATDEDVEDVKEKNGGEKDLYEVLGVDRKASQEEIRKAYHKLALRLHPDKNPDDETAKDKFQSLQSVIAILGDAEKRKVYDETGSVEDVQLSGDTFKNLYHFFRSLFKQVSEEDIDAFAASYRGSKEEALNLKDEYRRRKGNMNLVFTFVMCSNPKLDSHRFMDIIDSAISAGEMKEFKAYRRWAAEVSKEPAPLNPLAQTNRKKKENGEPSSSLMSLISGRGKDRMNSLASALEAKYGGGKKSRHSKLDHEPSEEEFQAAQNRAMKKSKTKGSKQD